MTWTNVRLFSSHLWRNVTSLKAFYVLFAIFMLLAAFAAAGSINNYHTQNSIREKHQNKARESWEANPDKHPHRMAHFGTFAFRLSPPLSFFDYGIENYTGSTIFLEAHKQNSVNFSEATFSTGSLRFGELSLALLLQLVLPLILFFVGFSSISADRENNTLKMLITQGATWKDILFGKSLGLFLIAFLFFVPVLLLVILTLLVMTPENGDYFGWLRLAIISLSYLAFFFVLSVLTVVISAKSSNPKNALVQLLAFWLFFVVFLPKSAQALGSYWYPAPSKLAFESAIEKDVVQKGDSHNPDDPHYNKLRDSVLAVHKVSKISELPFNYSGFVMREGEKISSQLYKKHYKDLLAIFHQQNRVTQLSSFLNPFTAVKQVSMIMAGTDFSAYIDFQEQADSYRYDLAQTMNELQMNYISPKRESGSEGKTHVVGHEHWEAFPDFVHTSMSFSQAMQAALWPLISIGIWVLAALGLVRYTSKNTSAL